MSFSGIHAINPGSLVDAIAELHASLIASIPNSANATASFIDFALPVDSFSISLEAVQANEEDASDGSESDAKPVVDIVTTQAVGEESSFFPIAALPNLQPAAQPTAVDFFSTFITTVFPDESAAQPPQITTFALGEEAGTTPPEVTTLALGEETGSLPPPTAVDDPSDAVDETSGSDDASGSDESTDAADDASGTDSGTDSTDSTTDTSDRTAETEDGPSPPSGEGSSGTSPSDEVPPGPQDPAPDQPASPPAPPSDEVPAPPPAITLAFGEEGSPFTFPDPRTILRS